MKSLLLILSLTTMTAFTQESIHEFLFKKIDGTEQSFSDFKGKKLMIVNTASECGFTPQYEELQKMHEKYGDQLIIIGFPANNYGGQEPGTNDEIQSFCKKNYGVTFMMAEKVSVDGDDIDPIFKWLTQSQSDNLNGEIKWNFEKFILDENGKMVDRFRSITKPDSEKVLKALGFE